MTAGPVWVWAVAGTIGMCGAGLAAWALLADRARGRPRCPKCWYLMIGATGLRCPECGHVAKSNRAMFRTRRRWRWALLGVGIAIAAPGYATFRLFGEELLLSILPKWKLFDEVLLGNYVVRRFEHRRHGRPTHVVITHNAEPVYARTAFSIRLEVYSPDFSRALAVGADITGNGIPNLILEEYSGGAHCCLTYYIFELDPQDGLRPIATIYGWHSGVRFEDLDGDGRVECILNDWTFEYWNTDYASSPAPEVILQFRGGRYVLAAEWMFKPPPDESAFAALVAEVRGKERWSYGSAPVAYWSSMLDLIYTGHTSLAWEFADAAWSTDETEKEAFLREFRAQLAESPYWPDVQALGQP